jgi:putative transposase
MLRDLLRRQGLAVGRKRIARLMKKRGIEAIYRKANTSRRNFTHKVYPYLLRNVTIDRPNQVWAMDITYLPMKRGFLYLAAVIDWHSRRILSFRLSNTMHTDFCIQAVNEAIQKYGTPEIMNTDQGSQFTKPGVH